MKKYLTIEVIPFNKIDDHIKWINKYRFNRLNKRDFPARFIEISFEKARNLKPYHITSLACLVFEYLQNGYRYKITNTSNEVEKYLRSFHFHNLKCSPEFNDFPPPSDRKTLPLWLIDQTAINLYPDHAKKYFENNHFIGKDLFALGVSLSELLNNIFDHSKSKIPGYTFTQYNSTSNRIITSLCDFGIGIPRNIKNFLKKNNRDTITSIEALKLSLENRFTTKSKPHNRGFGLETVIQNVKSLNGKLIIISNDVNYVLFPNNNEAKTYHFNHSFPGTLIVIMLDTRYLNVKEEEDYTEIEIF